MNKRIINSLFFYLAVLIILCMFTGCVHNPRIPHIERWGIYSLDISTQKVGLIYSTENEITMLRLNGNGDSFVFSMMIDGKEYESSEICTIDSDGSNFQRLTNNTFWDLYPVFSPDNSKIAYLSYQESTLDIYMMNVDGTKQMRFYDSGQHDADIHWVGDTIVFTSGSKIWKINDDGTNPVIITDPPRAGEWGNANLPFGDYDPNLHPDGTKIIFERMENDTSPHGNYNIFIIDTDGTNEVRLTNTYYSQGFPTWSHTGDKILLIVAAIEDKGIYHLYMIDDDGSNYQDITPTFFPDNFLSHQAIFSPDDSLIYFIGEWWE